MQAVSLPRRSTVDRIVQTAVLAAIVAIAAILSSSAHGQTFTTLHMFTGGTGGSNPANLILTPNGNITGDAGYNNCCYLLFSLSTAGKERILHRFPAAPAGSNAIVPTGYVLNAAGNVLYGITSYGGNYGKCDPQVGCGTVFSVDLSTGAEKTLHTFTNTPDGYQPDGNLAIAPGGTLYGITYDGGTNSLGSVFEITSSGSEKILYSFRNVPDGNHPAAGLVRNSGGNLFGVTVSGGGGPCNLFGQLGCGIVFKVTPSGRETVLYNFQGGNDGRYPYSLIGDSSGNLYGLARTVDNTVADVFKINAAGQFSIVYDGPFASKITQVILGPSGSFYGIADGGSSSCGPHGCGEIFQLFPDGSGGGTVNTLYSFNGAEGQAIDDLVLKNGTLYGSTVYDGGTNYGVVYKLVP